MAFAKSFKLGWCKSTEFTHYTQSLYLGIFVIGTTPNKVLLQINILNIDQFVDHGINRQAGR